MPDLKILSWNVEHFDGKGGLSARGNDREEVIAARKDRLQNIMGLIQDEDPDVFGISEVKSSQVYFAMREFFPDYTFQITEGNQSQEILVGARSGLNPFFTQKTEFKRSNPYLRPAVLTTVHVGDHSVQLLFAHLKSFDTPEGFGLRDAMYDKAYSLRNALNNVAEAANGEGAKANYIILGDMNTMGMDYDKSDHDISSEQEIAAIDRRMTRRDMKSLLKSHPYTFNNGSDSPYPHMTLDHVYAAEHLKFKAVNDDGAELAIKGWTELDTAQKQDKWIQEFSDHAYLVTTVEFDDD